MSSVGPSLPPDILEARLKKRRRISDSQTDNFTTAKMADRNSRTDSLPKTQIIESEEHMSANKVSTEKLSHSVASSRDMCGDVDDEDEDDDIGPKLPQDNASQSRTPATGQASGTLATADSSSGIPETSPVGNVVRPDWMLYPPSSTDWTKSIDTTKLKSRTFATHRARNTPADNTTGSTRTSDWTKFPGKSVSRKSTDEDTDLKFHDRQEKYHERQSRAAKEIQIDRGPSLYDQHNEKQRSIIGNPDEAVNRPFDREKDIGGNSSFTKTKEFAKNSKDLSSMFGTGKYL
ncbi:Putative uncharacterized protein [Taphrina deformans PYCC 5710]|uniref:DUF3752 domain-containing protein n=1 Tax=Taphrina deformans (strain PYCC 5710 / ATCC 11124 / CBS 356.35 / IMI 108563 / JCM 9778 / NBRC 8474) TaxID=1097556 RepID=R4X932_TAPDE|nr:Putative uncharacterized protein [Taphrina deformans PYCC 5710]|eukprot:CCG81935.1 Putative uncharacterized protein [Taphrina deformans PYCC 5710]